MKPAIIGGSICHAFNPDSSLSNFLLDFLFAGFIMMLMKIQQLTIKNMFLSND
ncbi:TPA: hypothetical protein IZ487_002364 [Enterococcus faecium]|nr:hypothetical protein [Enterococcus faecium]HBC2648597.1 hypothetical protein [Enterococcus faecium]HBC2769773.1 hypothetical protein [Enterococcus faecium]